MLEIMEDEGERWIEIVDDKLLGFLYNISDDVLKFVWKEKDIEILEKYFDENQSNYLDEIRNLDDEILWKNPENFELYTINLVRN